MRARPRINLTLLPEAIRELKRRAKSAGASQSQVLEAWLLHVEPKPRGMVAATRPKKVRTPKVRKPRTAKKVRTPKVRAVAPKSRVAVPSLTSLSPSEFAAVVTRAADASPRKFGRKTFVRGVWESLNELGLARGVSRAEFERKLIEARRSGDLLLTRADLVNAMNADDVRLSEVKDNTSVFHFITPHGEA